MNITTQQVKDQWPDSVRLKMIDKSEFYYPNEAVYQYGYYDGYLVMAERIREAIKLIQEARTSEHPDALLQDAILKLIK